jgi:hypothetical protein
VRRKGVAAQEAQHTPADGREFRIYRIYLAGTLAKPLSIKASAEQIESMDGTKVVSKHWVEDWVGDQDGRVSGQVRASQEEHPGMPPLAAVWLFDAGAGEKTHILFGRGQEMYFYDYDLETRADSDGPGSLHQIRCGLIAYRVSAL